MQRLRKILMVGKRRQSNKDGNVQFTTDNQKRQIKELITHGFTELSVIARSFIGISIRGIELNSLADIQFCKLNPSNFPSHLNVKC